MHIPFNILFLQSSLPPLASPNYLPMGLKVIPELQAAFSPHTAFLFFIRKVICGITFHPFPPNDINVIKGNLPSSFLLFLLPHPPAFHIPLQDYTVPAPWIQSFLFSVHMQAYSFFSLAFQHALVCMWRQWFPLSLFLAIIILSPNRLPKRRFS